MEQTTSVNRFYYGVKMEFPPGLRTFLLGVFTWRRSLLWLSSPDCFVWCRFTLTLVFVECSQTWSRLRHSFSRSLLARLVYYGMMANLCNILFAAWQDLQMTDATCLHWLISFRMCSQRNEQEHTFMFDGVRANFYGSLQCRPSLHGSGAPKTLFEIRRKDSRCR